LILKDSETLAIARFLELYALVALISMGEMIDNVHRYRSQTIYERSE